MHTLPARIPLVMLLFLLGTFGFARTSGAAADPFETAREVDAAVERKLRARGEEPPPLADDTEFLRRATLSLCGRLPSPDELTAIAIDPDPEKRPRAVDRLVTSEDFARRWARYWREAIVSRAQDQRVRIVAGALEEWFADAFAADRGWDQVVSEVVSARGPVSENGATGLIFAQMGQAVEIASETSRLFLGIQIQCAQCHDHPYDRWRREQFHELAAFFPRIRIARRNGGGRDFDVLSVDPKNPGVPGRPMRGEHQMPDLENPEEPGTLMMPVFFLDGETPGEYVPDQERRAALARYLTARDNPWFARAFVNRLWYEMVGRGFYEPVDNLGPDRDADLPEVLDLLAEGFADSGYSVRWLCRAIASTEVFQRRALERPPAGAEKASLAAPCLLRLGGHEVASALASALDLELDASPGRGRRGGGLRERLNELFGYDPSIPPEDVVGTMPQALFLMNSEVVRRGIDAEGGVLGRILRETDDDGAVVTELYLRTLAREPTAAELEIALEHVRTAAGRGEAFEDLFWCLLNSTEFLTKK